LSEIDNGKEESILFPVLAVAARSHLFVVFASRSPFASHQPRKVLIPLFRYQSDSTFPSSVLSSLFLPPELKIASI
jgi:hypothetical protein